MSEIKEVQINEKNSELDSKKRYSAYMKKLHDLARKNEKKNRKEN